MDLALATYFLILVSDGSALAFGGLGISHLFTWGVFRQKACLLVHYCEIKPVLTVKMNVCLLHSYYSKHST